MAYSAEEIEASELTLLQGLSWRIAAPTSTQIIATYYYDFIPFSFLVCDKV